MVQSTGMVVALAAVFLALQLLALGLRLSVRCRQVIGLGTDDYLAIAASFVYLLSILAIFVQCADAGLGDHVALSPSGEPEPPSYLFSVTERIYETLCVLPVGFAKLSILYLYRRIFRGKVFAALNAILIGLVIIWMIAYCFSLLLMCLPLSIFLNGSSDGLHCVNQEELYYSVAISDVVMDVLILIMPIPIVWRLKMPMRYKLAVSGILLLGGLTIAASIVRMQTFIVAANLGPEQAADYTWYSAPTSYWTLIEGSLAIISACLPTLKPLFHGLSLESAVRSFRSAFSLDSVRSRLSGTRRHGGSEIHDTSDIEIGTQQPHPTFQETAGSGSDSLYKSGSRE